MLMLYICVSSFVLYRHWDCDQIKGSSLEKGIRWNILNTSAFVLHLWIRYLVQYHCTFFIHQAVNGCSKRQIGQRLEQIYSRQGFYPGSVITLAYDIELDSMSIYTHLIHQGDRNIFPDKDFSIWIYEDLDLWPWILIQCHRTHPIYRQIFI